MNEKMVLRIKVFYNGHNFIFMPVGFCRVMEIISMGKAEVFENGAICVSDVVLKFDNWIYRGDFRYFLSEKISREYDFEQKLSVNTNY